MTLSYRKFIHRILIDSILTGKYHHALQCLTSPVDWGKARQQWQWNWSFSIEENEKLTIKLTSSGQISEFCSKIAYLGNKNSKTKSNRKKPLLKLLDINTIEQYSGVNKVCFLGGCNVYVHPLCIFCKQSNLFDSLSKSLYNQGKSILVCKH